MLSVLGKKTTLLAILFFFQGAWHTVAGAGESAIASGHLLATKAGFEILQAGGNAFDAAVAVGAALAVVEPAGSGLGGGGFWLLHRHRDGFETMLDGREKAPLAASRDMYLDDSGAIINGLSINGPLSAAIPGMPAALVHLSEHYGKLPLSESLAPAIRYAKNGFKLGKRHIRLLTMREAAIKSSPAAAAILLENGHVPELNTILRQTDLARTLERLATKGHSGFYSGETAAQLIAGVNASGGIWASEDMRQYQVLEREPVRGEYHGVKITSASPPSSGGIVLIEALNILAGYDLSSMSAVTRKHLIVEALRRAYHDRALYLGDPDFVKIPQQMLLSPYYAAGLRSSIRFDKALPSRDLSGQSSIEQGGVDTTHYSIIDSEGNRVAATLSINYPFGSGFMPPGSGVLLNDEMDDFSSRAGLGNAYGLTGGEANAIAPGKRMLSSMTPTFLEDSQRVAVLGTPGGSRIISMVLLAALDFADGKGPESWVWVPRFHHQYQPDVIQYEKHGLLTKEIKALAQLGHELKAVSYQYGNMQGVQLQKQSQKLTASSDPRGEGAAYVR